MKFRNKKTGKIFEDIKDAYEEYKRLKNCINCNVDCKDCKIYSKNNKMNKGCGIFVAKNPKQAAELMGYEVIDEPEQTIKESLIEQLTEDLPPEIQEMPPEKQEIYRKIVQGDFEDEPDQTTKDQAITLDELLRQTAEEATELAQAALKLLRALKGETPVTKEQALKNLTEEAADVKNCLMLLENNQIIRQGAVFEVQARKMERWKERVKERNGNNERT